MVRRRRRRRGLLRVAGAGRGEGIAQLASGAQVVNMTIQDRSVHILSHFSDIPTPLTGLDVRYCTLLNSIFIFTHSKYTDRKLSSLLSLNHTACTLPDMIISKVPNNLQIIQPV